MKKESFGLFKKFKGKKAPRPDLKIPWLIWSSKHKRFKEGLTAIGAGSKITDWGEKHFQDKFAYPSEEELQEIYEILMSEKEKLEKIEKEKLEKRQLKEWQSLLDQLIKLGL
jgi:hypothetical protein